MLRMRATSALPSAQTCTGSSVPLTLSTHWRSWSDPEAVRSRVPQEFHERSVLSASGEPGQGNERGWQMRPGGISQVDVINMQARR